MILQQRLGVAGDHQCETNHLRSQHTIKATVFILKSLASDHTKGLETHRAPEGPKGYLPQGQHRLQEIPTGSNFFPWDLTNQPP